MQELDDQEGRDLGEHGPDLGGGREGGRDGGRDGMSKRKGTTERRETRTGGLS